MPRHPLALVAAVVATASLAACGADEDGGRAATEAMMLETSTPTADPLEVEVCRCAFDAVSERYDDEELERLDRRLRDEPEQLPADVQEAILDCTFDVLAPPPATTSSTAAPDEG